MQAWAIIDNKFVETNDPEQVTSAMGVLAAEFARIGEDLSDTMPDDKADKLLKKYDFLSKRWNQNVEFLLQARQEQIRDIKAAIQQLKWPPGAADVEGSSS